MSKKRGSRPARFATIRGFFNTNAAGLLTSEAAKANVEATGFVIYDSELEKFAAEYPDVDMVKFTEFIKAHGAHKVAGKKVTGTQRQYQLNTPEKAAQIGVIPENVAEYVKLMNLGYQWKEKLQSIVPLGTVTISIPIRQPKAEATT